MSKTKKITPLLFVLAITLAAFIPSYANAAEPPCFTVIVKGAPNVDDFGMVVYFGDDDAEGLGDGEVEYAEARKLRSGWETYFRFYYHDLPGSHDRLSDLRVIVGTPDDAFEFDLPSETLNTYSNILTLDWHTRSVEVGQPAWRVPLLVAMRVIITLVVEFAVLLAFGYRKKRSFIVFAATNLVTQTLVNAAITGPVLPDYALFGFIIMEVLVLAVEAAVFAFFFDEHKRVRALTFAAVANSLSLICGVLVLSYLPV